MAECRSTTGRLVHVTSVPGRGSDGFDSILHRKCGATDQPSHCRQHRIVSVVVYDGSHRAFDVCSRNILPAAGSKTADLPANNVIPDDE